MARPRHAPDPVTRRQVEALAGYGVPETDIAGMLVIDPKTLRKHYRHELDHGHVKANAKVAESLFRQATGDGRQAVTAAIFWLKARARWKETTVTEIESKPVTRINRIIVTAPDWERSKQERDRAVARAEERLATDAGFVRTIVHEGDRQTDDR